MTAVNYPEQLKSALIKKLGEKDGLTANEAMGAIMLALIYNVDRVNPFMHISQSALQCDRFYDEHYVDQSKVRWMQLPAYYAIGAEIASRFFCMGKPIVELGAGEVDEKGKSLFNAMIPKGYDVVPTDFNPKVVAQSKKRNPKYTLLDMHRLHESQTTQFMACNVIDTLNPDQLKTFIKNFEALPEGSTFVHINDICPMLNAFAWDLISKGNLVFPNTEDGRILGAIVIDFNRVKDELSKFFSKIEFNFLEETAASKERNEQVFHHLVFKGDEAISKWLKASLPKSLYEEISITEHFLTKLKSLSSLKLEILFCDTMKKSVIVDKSSVDQSLMQGLNYRHNDKGFIYSKNCYVLHPDKIMLAASLIVFAIRRVTL